MPDGPKWGELFLILYRTLFLNKTDAVIVCLIRILTIEQIILNPVPIAKHLVDSSRMVIFAKTTAHRNQLLQRATMLE